MSENGLVDAAIQILEYVITPVLPPIQSEYSKYRSAVRFRLIITGSMSTAETIVERSCSYLANNVVLAFDRQIKKTIDLTKQVDPENACLRHYYSWRMDIPNRLSELCDADTPDI